MLDTKILLISHIADPDGITPVIFAQMVFKNIEIRLLEIKDVDRNIEEIIPNIDNYDEVHIVDLNMSYDMALRINENEKLKSKFRVFDHHISVIALNEFPFITVVDERNGRKESGTSLYYEYLKTISDCPLLFKDSARGLVNQVRSIDTYDFNEVPKEQAHNIDCLFGMFGREEYINYFTEYIEKHDKFEYTERENFLISLENNRIKRYLESKAKEMMKVKIDGHLAGLVYAERYRSDLGNYLASNNDDLDFVILINVSRSISYRSIDKTDLSVFTKKYNGGGHRNAAGSPIPGDFLKEITKLIYKDIEFVEVQDETNSKGFQ